MLRPLLDGLHEQEGVASAAGDILRDSDKEAVASGVMGYNRLLPSAYILGSGHPLHPEEKVNLLK